MRSLGLWIAPMPMSLYTRPLSRIARTRPWHAQWRHTTARLYASAPGVGDDGSWFPALRREMLDRPVVFYRECVNVDTSRKLTDTLHTFLPPEWCGQLRRGHSRVPMGYTLLWFNTSMPVDQLLPDGTDPLQSPGGPWVRRMWAGGQMKLRPEEYYHKRRGLVIDSDMLCAERIQDVQLKGSGDAAKIYVTLERRFARWDTLQTRLAFRSRSLKPQALFKQQLVDEEWGDAVLKEERNLVFLKEKTPAELEAIRAGQLAPTKYLDAPPPGEPDFAHKLTPTRSLLFRYSALTFNAHLIHLDQDYARKVEGHRNLLVHGPLALTLLLQAISSYVTAKTEGQHTVESIQYRNLAPLDCDEPMRLCGRVKKTFRDGELYDVWIEGLTGGVAVKGTVRTARIRRALGDTDGTERMPASATKRLTHEPFYGPHIRKIPVDTGVLVPATSSDRLKGSRKIKMPSRMPSQTATPGLEDERTPDTAEDPGASVRRSLRSVASVAPNLQPRHREQQETKSRDTHTVDPPKIRLSTFVIPPAPSPSEEPSSPMLRPKSSHTRQPSNRAARTRQGRAMPDTGSLIHKYTGTPYIRDPTDVARRHSRFMKRGIQKISHPRIRKTAGPINPESPVWQRL